MLTNLNQICQRCHKFDKIAATLAKQIKAFTKSKKPKAICKTQILVVKRGDSFQ
jgi:hypothetical protein